jgi:hypothetical protein
MLRIILATTLLSLTAATVAHADPCEGRLQTLHGETFAGTVRYVGDGDSLCVGRTSNPNDWIEVRLADFDAPELRERDGRRSRDILTRLRHRDLPTGPAPSRRSAEGAAGSGRRQLAQSKNKEGPRLATRPTSEREARKGLGPHPPAPFAPRASFLYSRPHPAKVDDT